MAERAKLEDLARVGGSSPRTVHHTDVLTDLEYEKGLAVEIGVNEMVCGSKRICLGRTIIPPHTANERHIHANAEAAMFIVRGTMTLFLGPEAKMVDCRPGTFVYAPEGVVHGVANRSRTEEVELIFAYGGVPSKEAARIVFIDDSGNDYPPKGWDDTQG
jgi:uncharacterized RmlC-like cupin family protein